MPVSCSAAVTDAWADALERVAADRPRMIAAGLARAASFSVRASGAALAAVVRRGVGERVTTERRLRIAVLCPHFAPDTAPTGEVMTRIVHEIAALGHEVHVVTSLPWYRSARRRTGMAGQVDPSRADARGVRSPG